MFDGFLNTSPEHTSFLTNAVFFFIDESNVLKKLSSGLLPKKKMTHSDSVNKKSASLSFYR